MGFKEVQDLDCDTTVALGGIDKKTKKKNPTKVEGYYLGSKTIVSAKAKSGFAKIHIFQTPTGKLGVWGKTDSDRKMANAVVGQMTKIEFDKMLPTPNGDMYKYKVAQDEDNTIEVNIANNITEEELPPVEEEYEEEAVEEQEVEQEEEALDETPPARPVAAKTKAVAPDAARQAKVKALLGKRATA
jgi:hypothetical protein